MPTGYTAAVVDGKITEFPEFALQCARAFGALIMMRDDPSDAPIPDEFKPSDYNERRLAEARLKLKTLQSMTPEEAEAASLAAYEELAASNAEYERRCQVEDDRLNAMLTRVHAWTPPTSQHVEMKQFMIEQLAISFNGKYRPTPAEKLSGAEWMEKELKQAHHDIGYHAGEQAKEIERANSRTEWVRTLRNSLLEVAS